MLTKEELAERIFYGGPEVSIACEPQFFSKWFSSYLQSYVERDVRNLSRLLDVVSFSKVFRLAALHTGNMLDVKNLAMSASVDVRTVNRYLEMFEMTFQAHLLRPWSNHSRKTFVKTPKIYLNDSGFACYLARLERPADLTHHPMQGALLETWVWAELRKLLAFFPNSETYFYRTHRGQEVDFVIAQGDQHLGIECKMASRVTVGDFNGLKDMQKTIGEKTKGIMKGVILYGGNEMVPFGNHLAAIPLSWLG